MTEPVARVQLSNVSASLPERRPDRRLGARYQGVGAPVAILTALSKQVAGPCTYTFASARRERPVMPQGV